MRKDTLLYYTNLGAAKPDQAAADDNTRDTAANTTQTKSNAASAGSAAYAHQKYSPGYLAAHGLRPEDVMDADEASMLPAKYEERESAKNSPDSKFVDQPVNVSVTYTDETGNTYEEKVDSNFQEQAYQQARDEILRETEKYVRENAELDDNGNVVDKNYVQEYLDKSGRWPGVSDDPEEQIKYPGAYISDDDETNGNGRAGVAVKKTKWSRYGVAAAALMLAVVATDDGKDKEKKTDNK